MKPKALLVVYLFLFLYACKAHYSAVSQQSDTHKVTTSTLDTLSPIAQLLKPYRDSMSQQMNIELGQATADFKKEKPSGTLGHLVADALMKESKHLQLEADACIYNYGGVRINELKKGLITVGKIYELLPFENELVTIEVPGVVLKEWLELILKGGGWPISKELRIESEGGKNHFHIRSTNPPNDTFQEIENTKVYHILTNDYVANGGDNCSFLKELKKKPTGKLIRDIVMQYVTSEGKISPDYQPRINVIK